MVATSVPASSGDDAALRAEGDMAVITEAEDDNAHEEGEGEEESEEAQTLWQAAFTFLPVLSSVIFTCAAEAVEAGTCQLILVMCLPVWAAIKQLLGIIEAPSPYGEFAPPPPPSHTTHSWRVACPGGAGPTACGSAARSA